MKGRLLTDKLEKELTRLNKVFGLNLKLQWLPSETVKSSQGGTPLSGQVINETIHIYDKEPEKALATLKHEVIDFLISGRIQKPNLDLINILITHIQGNIYKQKEELIEKLTLVI